MLALLLFQSFGRELLVANYELNKARITARYCVNKARPQLHCNGKCHLARQLRQADGADRKAPAGPVAKVKFEVLLPAPARLVLQAPRNWARAARRYAPALWRRHTDAPATGVFRPPLYQV